MKINDPNQFIIYTPKTSGANQNLEVKKTETSKKSEISNREAFNESLKATKNLYEEGNFSEIKSGEKETTEKAGENLSRGVITSTKTEKEEITEKSVSSDQEGEKPVKLKDDCSQEELKELRGKTKDDYGDGLINNHHKGANTVEEHEAAQIKAYEALSQKVEAGVVKPDSIASDMLNILELRGKPEPKIGSSDQISGHIGTELKELTDKGFIKADEAALIQKEADKFTKLYGEAFPEKNPQEIFQLVRDNSRKLAYQTERDKHVFSGSDHGTKHILEGNMTMADRMLDSLGDRATAKDKALIHQIIVDHDLGYTVGVAQAKNSFEASKDHPIFSTGYVEENKDYYIQKFGQNGYEMIKDGILQHSYPKSEYNTPTDPEKGFNPDMIRSVTSTVDALGVTAETKCPAFFREPQVVNTLQKVQMYADTHYGKVPPEMMDKYTQELHKLADKETDKARRDGFHEAIGNHFNAKTPEFILGQYTGVLKDITLEEKDGKIIPDIKMDISRSQALLGDLFGDKMGTKAFTKAMADFGVSKDQMADMGSRIERIREAENPQKRKELSDGLRYESDIATFQFGTKFDEVSPEVTKVFEEAQSFSIRRDIRDLSRELQKPEGRTPQNMTSLMNGFRKSLSEKGNSEDLLEFTKLQGEMQDNLDNPKNFDSALKKLGSFTTKQERIFMGAE